MNIASASRTRRLPEAASQVLNRQEVVRFTFNGKEYRAYEGDTIASALAAAGVATFSRSFKYHRKRGLLCASGNCPNCLVQVGDTPNVRSCVHPVEDGLEVEAQNVWPSLESDVMSMTQLVDRFLPVGFYYKTFMRPQALWPVYEKVLRKAAGLGKVNEKSEAHYFDKIYKHADVAVIGGGPAGLQAARRAADAGAQVILLEEQNALGGHLRHNIYDISGQAAHQYIAQYVEQVVAHDNIEMMLNTNAFGHYDHSWIGAVQGNRLVKLRAKSLVVATGATAIPALFNNNDLPGIMLSSGVQRMIHLWGIKPGQQAVVLSANRRGLQTALDMLAAGIRVGVVAEMRPEPDADIAQQLLAKGVAIFTQSQVINAEGHDCIEAVVLKTPSGNYRHLCDLLVMAVGYLPNNGLIFQAGGRFAWDETLNEFVPQSLPQYVYAAGEVNATHDLVAIEHEGQLAGMQAALAAGYGDSSEIESLREQVEQAQAQRRAWTQFRIVESGKKQFVCLCEDVTHKDIKQSIEEGYDSMELLKRYSTVSMGPCQGRMCNMAAMQLCAHYNEQSIAETGTTTSRPPVRPVTLGALGGRLMEPVRYSALHHWHVAHNAHMMVSGLWKRPEYYRDPAEEVRAVRERVGIIDVSTLGKFHLHGKDIASLLERLYVNRWRKLKVGRVRYGVMTNDEGVVMDDGVTAHLEDDFYYMTATSGGASQLYEWIEWWLQSAWDYDIHLLNATDMRAAINIAGPRSRDVLRKLCEDVDLSSETFPYMAARQGTVAGVPALMMRIGFTGELSYELHVPSGYALHIWQALLEAGQEYDIIPFGVEAQRTLRLEKGHIIVGQDTDALTNPLEADLGWAVKLEKEDFLGKHSLERINQRGLRNKLVGFTMPDGTLPEEANQIVRPGNGPVGLEIIGRVTSVRRSPTLNKVVGLCWLPAALSEPDTEFMVRVKGVLKTGKVLALPFYDPEGSKLRS